jgi:hypothetical protein
MTDHQYHFISDWRVRGTVEEVTDIFRRGGDLSRWWPATYLESKEVDPGDSTGLGYTVDLHSKSFLPYTIRWRAKAIEVNHPYGYTIETSGDFVGRGTWTFKQDGEWVDITYDWQIRADKPLLRHGAFLLKPLYEFNHRWAMTRGEESLKIELERRYAKTPEERARIPMPPGPTQLSPLTFLVGLGAIVAGLVFILTRLLR